MKTALNTLLLFALVAAVPFASGKRINIVVDARASDEYMEASEALPYQTYHFIKGAHFEGNFRDRQLEDSEFEDIAESLVVALKKRKYYPETDQNLGDLMILVSYGVTAVDTDYTELMGIASADDYAPSDNSGEGALSVESVGSVGETALKARPKGNKNMNMKMLGFEKGLDDAYNRFTRTNELEDALDDERYFVVLNAFDYQHFLKNGELKQTWSVRYSTKAAGVGFKMAFASMNEAVSGVFGLQVDKLAQVKGDTESNVTFGELEVQSYGETEEE